MSVVTGTSLMAFRKPSMIFGLSVLVFFVFVAIFAPFLEPYDPRTKTGAVYEPPSRGRTLGRYAVPKNDIYDTRFISVSVFATVQTKNARSQ